MCRKITPELKRAIKFLEPYKKHDWEVQASALVAFARKEAAMSKCPVCGSEFIHPDVVWKVKGVATCSPDCALERATKIREKLSDREHSDSTEMVREDRER
jgi:hypothetical protein